MATEEMRGEGNGMVARGWEDYLIDGRGVRSKEGRRGKYNNFEREREREREGGGVVYSDFGGRGIQEKGKGDHPSNDGYKGRMRGGVVRARRMGVREIRAV